MKRNIISWSLLLLMCMVCFIAKADSNVTEDDWDDWGENPGDIDLGFYITPTAEFLDLKLHLSARDPETIIYWTLESNIIADGSDAWNLYTTPITLDKDCTVSYYGLIEGGVESEVQTFKFVYSDYRTSTPFIEQNEDGTKVMISCATPDAEIYYTLDGSEPTQERELYSDPVLVEAGMKVRARAYASNLFDSEICDYLVMPTGLNRNIAEGFKICVEGGKTVIYSDRETMLHLFSLTGIPVYSINVKEGRNEVGELNSGLYLIGNHKIKL